jgi:hypothetical protein
MRKLHLTEAKWEDFYGGHRPHFARSDIKKKNVGRRPSDTTPSPSTSTTPKPASGTPNSAVSSKSSSPSGTFG